MKSRLGIGICVAFVLWGCRPTPDDRMLRLPPPPDWTEEIATQRRVRDDAFRNSPGTPLLPEARASFPGLDYWEPDAAYYFVGFVKPYAEPERFEIITTAGQLRPCEKVGWLEFPLGGSEQRLQVYRLLDGDGGLFLPFQDGTTGEETYPAGRYVDLDGPQGGPYVLDFNRAYNPSCAYGDPSRFQCPVTPPENRLGVRIEAGERGYRPEA